VASLTLQQLEKTFSGDVRAVDSLSLEVASGELLVIVGPSGCGKTTTLRLIAGLEVPTAGTIQIGDRDVTRLAPAKRNVAMAFQDHALYPNLNVYDNLAFGLRMRGGKPASFDADIRQMAALLQIEELLKRRPHALSEGQRQRVALGRALVRRPECFLLDEPLASLDDTLRAQLRDDIKRLHRELDTTMIFVTHDQYEAMMLADRIAVMDKGRLQQCDMPAAVYSQPANVCVATRIGSPTMNLLRGQLVADGDDLHFEAGPWQVSPAAAQAAALANHAGQEIVLGVRPTAVRFDSSGQATAKDTAAPDSPLTAQVTAVQALGDSFQVELQLADGQSLLARGSLAFEATVGDSCSCWLDAANLHFFAADAQGRNLLCE